MTKNLLCVGGPLNGLRYPTGDSCHSFRVPVLGNEVRTAADREGDPAITVEIESVVYDQQAFSLPGEPSILLWAPVGQSASETMDMIIAGFERSPEAN